MLLHLTPRSSSNHSRCCIVGSGDLGPRFRGASTPAAQRLDCCMRSTITSNSLTLVITSVSASLTLLPLGVSSSIWASHTPTLNIASAGETVTDRIRFVPRACATVGAPSPPYHPATAVHLGSLAQALLAIAQSKHIRSDWSGVFPHVHHPEYLDMLCRSFVRHWSRVSQAYGSRTCVRSLRSKFDNTFRPTPTPRVLVGQCRDKQQSDGGNGSNLALPECGEDPPPLQSWQQHFSNLPLTSHSCFF